jgi:hypothetical protein
MFLCILPARANRTARPDNAGYVALVQKDAAFHVISPEQGGASGRVWFDAAAPAFHFRLAANGLKPAVRYMVELNVDGATYVVTSQAADTAGRLAIDTTLTRFVTGECTGNGDPPPRPLRGEHEIKFLVKRDGYQATGLRPGPAPAVSPARPCHGNGDSDFTYALFEGNVGHYTGTR